jgi:hypothetical protein
LRKLGSIGLGLAGVSLIVGLALLLKGQEHESDSLRKDNQRFQNALALAARDRERLEELNRIFDQDRITLPDIEEGDAQPGGR